MSEPTDKSKAVFKVVIKGTIDQVWRELTKTDEVQQAMFNSRLHTPGLAVGNPMCMRSPSGRFTNVIGNIIEIDEPARFAHTFRFTTADDPPSTIVYDLREVEGGVEFTLTVLDLPVGTKTEKQMRSGGKFIVDNMKSIIETGRPSLGTRLIYVMFKVMEPFGPAKAKSEAWSYDVVKKAAARTSSAAVVALALHLCAGVTAARAGEALDAAKAFERLKSLAGRWEGTGGEAGKPGAPLVIEYEVTAGGTAVMEKVFAGEPHEMVTVFTMDGKELIATHYCSGGNQPHYRFEPSTKPGEVTMGFDGGTSLDPSKDGFIHDVKYDLSADGKVRAELTNYAAGKAAGKIEFQVERK